MKNYFTLLLLLFALFTRADYWTQKANFTGGARYDATSFTVNGKGYVCCGWSSTTTFKDLWEFDPTSNSWTRKADLPGIARSSPVSFVIGGKAYVGTGSNLNDLWEYDPVTDSWSQKASLPGAGRRRAMSFAIGNIGYIYGGVTSSTTMLNDLWAYDPALNSWVQKNNGPSPARCWGLSFVINDTAYVGAGENGNLTDQYDIWKYNFTNDQWIQVSNYPLIYRSIGVASFAIGNYAYSGISFSSGNSYITTDTLWRYNPVVNYWIRQSRFPAASRYCSVSFSMGGKGYIGLGKFYLNSGPDSIFYDFWEYTPDSTTNLADSDMLKSSSLNITPNPNNGYFEIIVPKELKSEDAILSIYNNTGKLIRQKTLQMNEGKIKVSLEAEARGVYNAILSNGRKAYSGKIVFE